MEAPNSELYLSCLTRDPEKNRSQRPPIQPIINQAIARRRALRDAAPSAIPGTEIFRLGDLPVEIITRILSFAARIPCYVNLTLVSREICHLTRASCLPKMGIVLNTKGELWSFNAMIRGHPETAQHVRHLWIIAGISAKDEIGTGGAIIRECRNLTSLACRLNALQAAIVFQVSFRHTELKYLTLLEDISSIKKLHGIGRSYFKQNLDSTCAEQLLAQITHLRIPGPVSPPNHPTSFSKLTHLSYDDVLDNVPVPIGDMPLLKQVVVTLRSSRRFQPIETPKDPRLHIRRLSLKHQESAVWLEEVEGRPSRLWY